MSIFSWSLSTAPLVALDIETTGLSPSRDRIVEIAIVTVPEAPDQPTTLLFDSLIQPQRPMRETRKHGLTDDDVRDAPTFDRASRGIARALRGAVVVAHNATFDISFLREAFAGMRIDLRLPYICTRNLPRLEGSDGSGTLGDACSSVNLTFEPTHRAKQDAHAVAYLMASYRVQLSQKYERFHDLALQKDLAFVRSWQHDPPDSALENQLPHEVVSWPREAKQLAEATSPPDGFDIYEHALMEVLLDGLVTSDELTFLAKLRDQYALSKGQVRAAHARIFQTALHVTCLDHSVDAHEQQSLASLRACLQTLGWAPGDPI